MENNTTDNRPFKSIAVGGFGFHYLDSDEDGDGIADDQAPCPDSTLEPPFNTMQVDRFGCTPNQNLLESLSQDKRT